MPSDDFYRVGVLEGADVMCGREVFGGSSCGTTLRLLGLLMSRVPGHLDAALACLRRAVASDAGNTTLYVDLADLLTRHGRHGSAVAAYLSALILIPDTADPRAVNLYVRIGRALKAMGRLHEAGGILRLAQASWPRRADVHGLLGDILLAQGRLAAANEQYETALRLTPHDAEALGRLGTTLLTRGDWAAAFACFQKGLQETPCLAALHVGTGDVLVAAGDIEGGVRSFRAALEIAPTDIGASRCLVRGLEGSGHQGDAAYAWLHLGRVFQAHARYEHAVTAYRKAVLLTPEMTHATTGLAHAYIASGRPRDSLPYARMAVAQAGGDTAARIDLGTAYHLLGDAERGWDEFARFYDPHEFRRRQLDCPLWDGSPLHGRTILLWTDMGRGDAIQSLRYISVLRNEAGRIVVQSHHPGLIPLIERIPGVDKVVTSSAPVTDCDVHAPLNFFPALVKGRLCSSCDTVPYLGVDEHAAQSWRGKLGQSEGLTIGLSWGGNAETVSADSRFIPLRAFRHLCALPNARFVSLQHGPQAAELLITSAECPVEQVLVQSSSISDAAAVIVNLDLVITVDTMIAHLTGALARPVWTLLRYATNWRWRSDGDRTSWYPTMRLFRQSRTGDWNGVFERVQSALQEFSTSQTSRGPQSGL